MAGPLAAWTSEPSERAIEAVRAAVAARPDIALEELRLRLRRRERVRVSVPTLYRVIETLWPGSARATLVADSNTLATEPRESTRN